MASIKEKRTRSYVLIVVLVGLVIIAAGIWAVYFRNKSYSSDATAYVDGRIETDGNEIDKAYEKFYSTDPSGVIQDNTESKENKIALLFVGVTEEADINNEILQIIEKSGVKASFALSSADGMENEDFVNDLLTDNYELISNGTSGEGNVHNRTSREMIETMLRSREKLSTMADVQVPYIYCSSTKLTSDILHAAAVSGYDAIINADHVLDADSFQNQSDAESYLGSISGETILVVNLRGITEAIQNEDSITAQKPVIDLQANLDDSKSQEETEEIPLTTQIQWLLDTISSRKITTEYISDLKVTDGPQILKTMAEDKDAEKATIYHSCLTDKKVIGAGIKGLPEKEKLDEFLQNLEKENASVTFFVTAEEAKERTDDIQSIIDAGCSIGINGYAEEPRTLSSTEAFDEIYSGIQALSAYEQDGTKLYLTEDNENIDNICIAAKLLNVRVICPENPETASAGALYLIDAADLTDKNIIEKDISDLQEKASKAELTVTDIKSVMDEAGNIPVLSAEEISSMRKKNAHQTVETQISVSTTERAMSFVFYGFNHKSAVLDAAHLVKEQNGKATFFVTLTELMACQTEIEHIIEDGHEIGISYRVSADYPQTFDSVANYINSWKTYAKWKYGIDSSVIFMPSDSAEEETEEAANVSGCKIVGSTFRVVKNDDKNITKADISTVMKKISNMRLQRGSFVCFNMEFYENDQYTQSGDSIFGAMLKEFIKEHVDTLAYTSYKTGEIEDASRFSVVTASSLLASPEIYTLTDKKRTDISLSKNVLTNMKTENEKSQYIIDHYIGTASVDKENRLPGFTEDEISKLDKTGRFTDDKVLFLTFDDWGTEQSLNELLYVLEKHNVKGTFFIKTEYVDSNPNLLRAIAEQGHQIASHTDGHIPLADSTDEDENVDVPLTEAEALQLREDVVTSYNKLYKYTGDVTVDGKKALSKMFRPPTLAVSKIGISQIFDVGFEYSISGELSTGDYEAESYDDMLQRIQKRSLGGGNYAEIQNGSVIVMHMQENAKYTAQVLDTMIPKWKEEGYSFARIDEYLGN